MLKILLALIFFVTPLAAQTPDKWREDLTFMAREMESTHKNLFHTMTRQQFEAAVKNLDQRIPTLQRHQIIVEMMKIVAMVDDGHSNIYPTRDAKIAFHSLPVQLYIFRDGMFVRAAKKENADLVGARIVRIGSATVEEAIARVGPLVGKDSEMGLKFFATYLLAMPEILHAVGLSDSIESANFTIERSGKQETISLKPSGPVQILPADTDVSWIPQEGWVDMREAATPPLWLRDINNAFWYEYLPGSRTVYAQINHVGNKKDETLAAFATRLTTFVDTNPVDKLIIDLRLNRGGNGELLKPLEVALLKSKIDQPGRLFILMGRSTWSASQFFLNWMEKYSSAVFVGEPSGSVGNVYGDSRRITLPNSGITVRVSVYYWQDWAPWDTRLSFGPNVAAELSSSDYKTNNDPALNAALRYTVRKTLLTQLNDAISSGGVDLAVRRFREWKLDPVNKYAETETALLETGQRLLNEKKPADAIELFKLDIAENPHSWRGYFAVGVAYNEAGKKDLAITYLKKALDLNPKSYDVARYLSGVAPAK
jgi:hypothetical protein